MKPEDFSSSAAGRVVRTLEGRWAFIPNPLPLSTNLEPDVIYALSEADRAVGELAGMGRMLPNPHLLIKPFMRREAVLSSRIEGTRASLSDLYAFEAVQARLWDREPNSDVNEVVNYVYALEHALALLIKLPVSLRLIRETHSKLLEGVRGGTRNPGEFRRSQNWIGPPGCTLEKASFVPPPPNEILSALDKLEQFFYQSTSIPPLIRLAMIHYQFEAIHPFLDGNGRLGRMIIVLLSCAWGLLPQPLLYISAFFEANREFYYDLLQAVSTRGAWNEWFLFFLKGVERQSRDALVRAKRLQDLQEGYYERFKTSRSPSTVFRLVDLLFQSPVITIPKASKYIGTTYMPASHHVREFIKAGILREVGGRSRNRLYIANEILDTVEGAL
ncbi:MAG: Fic family protein [Bacillota bacterium]